MVPVGFLKGSCRVPIIIIIIIMVDLTESPPWETQTATGAKMGILSEAGLYCRVSILQRTILQSFYIKLLV